MLIKGMEFPLAAKQSNHVNSEITGKVWAYHHRMPKNTLPEAKDYLWSEKKFNRVHVLAEIMAEQKGTVASQELHSALWRVLFNQPSNLVIYTNKLDDTMMGVIKFCLTHGIAVPLEDTYMGYKKVLKPVINLYDYELFKTFKVELINFKDLPTKYHARVTKKRLILAKARDEFMKYVWIQVNEVMADITEFYALDKIETATESAIWADRYAAHEKLKAYGVSATIYDLDKTDLLDKIKHELGVWGPAFGINLKLTAGISEVQTFKPNNWYKHHPSYVHTPEKEMKITHRIKRGMKASDLNEIIDAYMQLTFYKQFGTEFLAPGYYICPWCKHPVNENAENCGFCDAKNSEVEPEMTSYELYSYKLNSDDQE